MPPEAVEDALHIAVATLNGMDYLLTWNFGHIANATMRYKIERVCRIEQSKRTHPEDAEPAPDILQVNSLKAKTSR